MCSSLSGCSTQSMLRNSRVRDFSTLSSPISITWRRQKVLDDAAQRCTCRSKGVAEARSNHRSGCQHQTVVSWLTAQHRAAFDVEAHPANRGEKIASTGMRPMAPPVADQHHILDIQNDVCDIFCNTRKRVELVQSTVDTNLALASHIDPRRRRTVNDVVVPLERVVVFALGRTVTNIALTKAVATNVHTTAIYIDVAVVYELTSLRTRSLPNRLGRRGCPSAVPGTAACSRRLRPACGSLPCRGCGTDARSGRR
ncbi:hypothetical protein GQR58_029935 [Nymphon striatum]|nr:hypothetical protein GQR58_029935 [Nymphon striatum]